MNWGMYWGLQGCPRLWRFEDIAECELGQVGCAGLRGWPGPCIAVAVVPTSLGRVVRGSAGGRCRIMQTPEQQCGDPLSCCQSHVAGKAAICLR